MFIIEAIRQHFGPPTTVDRRSQRLADRPITPRWFWIAMFGVVTLFYFSYLDAQSQSGEDSNLFFLFAYGVASLVCLGGWYRAARRGVWVDKNGIGWRGAIVEEHAQWTEIADFRLEEETLTSIHGDYHQRSYTEIYPVTIQVAVGSSRGHHRLPLTHRSITEAKRNVDAMRRHSQLKLDLRDETPSVRDDWLID